MTDRPTAPPSRAEVLLATAIFTVATALLYATSPTNLDFSWQDAPRHALDGAFIRDLVAAMPLHDPGGWAMQYYVKYPALTILFYPPAFTVVEALFYAVFGVSHWVAQLTETPYILALALAAYGIARHMLPGLAAIAAGLLAIGVPETAFWARQVMLDVPAYATLMAAIWCATRHFTHGRTSDLIWAAVLLVAAVYTKQTVVFVLPALAVGLVAGRGWRALVERRMILTALAAIVLMLPEAFLTLKFSAVNVESVSGRAGDAARASLDAWLFYPRLLPSQLGWPVLVLGLCGALAILIRPRLAGPRWAAPLLLVWLIIGYAFFSLIGVREPRHDMMILFPLIVCAALALTAALRSLAAPATAALALGTFAYSLLLVPAPTVSGFRQAADLAAQLTPKDGVVLFSGYRDGNFVYAMRTHAERPDITTIRADKLLLRVAIERERGVGQTDADEAEIGASIQALGVGLVVEQVGFWSDLRQMARLQSVFDSPLFERVAEFPVEGLLSTNDRAGRTGPALVRVYKPTYKIEAHPDRLRIDIPTIGRSVDGKVTP